MDNNENLDKLLGLEGEGNKEISSPEKPETVKKSTKSKDVLKDGVKKADDALKKAAASAAVKAAMESSSDIAMREAEKAYTLEKKKFMLNKCKQDKVVEFVGQKIFANYFGSEYTFLYNTIPVTIKFDGSKQKFPKFIYDHIMNKINEVSDSNTPKEDIEDRTK